MTGPSGRGWLAQDARRLRRWFESWLHPFDFNKFPVDSVIPGEVASNAKGWGQEVVSG